MIGVFSVNAPLEIRVPERAQVDVLFVRENRAITEEKETEKTGKMQFETLRQFCSSVLSHFNGAFSPPQNILQTELFEQALSNIG